jgi:uncharacterized protein (TIGR03435 family)
MSLCQAGASLWRNGIVFCMVVFSGSAGYAQPAERRFVFEVASVKRAPPERPSVRPWAGGPGTKDPGLFSVTGLTLLSIVMNAYDVKVGFQFVGLPWMDIERYTIRAKVPPGSSHEEFLEMLRNLLVDRFDLKTHHEVRMMSGYRLVVAKGGSKLMPSPSAGPIEPGQAETSLDATLKTGGLPPGVVLGKNGIPKLAPGNTPNELVTVEGHFLRARHETAEQIVTRISRDLRRPVIDATGLKGDYDYDLVWGPAHFAAGDAGSDSDRQPGAPPLFEALKLQLGLELQPVKGAIPIDVLVVDYAKKVPTEN